MGRKERLKKLIKKETDIGDIIVRNNNMFKVVGITKDAKGRILELKQL